MDTLPPRFVALKSNHHKKYLRYIVEIEEGKEIGHDTYRYLQFSGEDVWGPDVKFELERYGESGLWKIRCCYNNKYWSCSNSYSAFCVAGEADEASFGAEFWLEYNPAASTIRILYAGTHRYLTSWRTNPPYDGFLAMGSSQEPEADDPMYTFTVVDWDTLVPLPRFVAFKGDNTHYLGGWNTERHPFLRFMFNWKTEGPVAHEIFRTPDGYVRVKNLYFNRFWRLSPGWIWADSTDPSTHNIDRDTLFRPFKVDDSTVALRSVGNNFFCKRLTADRKDDCLNACIDRITSEAHLKVEELVLERNIYNVRYRFRDARIYNRGVKLVGTSIARNRGCMKTTMDVKVGMKYTRSNTWKWSFSGKFGVKTEFEIKAIPFIVGGKLDVSVEVGGGYEWGETTIEEVSKEDIAKVEVPEKSKVTVNAVARVAEIEVPYSYTQRDKLFDGTYKTPEDKHDGMYAGTGAKYYDVEFEFGKAEALDDNE